MRGVQLGLLVTAVCLGGCAAGPYGKNFARLQSQVGLLDERVAQLERASGGTLSAASSGETPAAEASAPAQAERGPAGKEAPAANTASSLKPSTREIQQALKNAGFYQGSLDGKMGPSTRDAVKEFQRVHGLSDDGVVGKRTWAKLRAFADLSVKSGEASAAEILK